MNDAEKNIAEKFNVSTLIWDGKALKLIDQRKLPFEETYVICRSPEDVFEAIRNMVVRGAPAIGVTAAYGVALAALQGKNMADISGFKSYLLSKIELIASSRPTAVNLFWALERMKKIIEGKNNYTNSLSSDVLTEKIVAQAEEIEKEDVKINKAIGDSIFRIYEKSIEKYNILTHCNAGALATAGYGTALGVIRSLHSAGMVKNVIVDETRPYLQGARLTAWELHRERIPFFIITDNMSAFFISQGHVDMAIVGADRIAANGDTANKIGTLAVSVLCKNYSIPFYVAAPVSTIDLNTENGTSIPIENRPDDEVRKIMGNDVIPPYMPVKNPSFDVTPNEHISAIITEKGAIVPPFSENIKNIF
ncbi:MAG: S-methyl-5-thioribose-1-phosphate isomerase [Actinobacteria bacterium]|nr:S-methyl-5-thioribose-1-phosphate isomerase [Actinomycetota bacterium]